MKKEIWFHPQAKKEINNFPIQVQEKVYSLIRVLEAVGTLEDSDAKKLRGYKNLFEIRVRYLGQWRIIYAYHLENYILILAAFQKKTQKTPSKIIKIAINRKY